MISRRLIVHMLEMGESERRSMYARSNVPVFRRRLRQSMGTLHSHSQVAMTECCLHSRTQLCSPLARNLRLHFIYNLSVGLARCPQLLFSRIVALTGLLSVADTLYHFLMCIYCALKSRALRLVAMLMPRNGSHSRACQRFEAHDVFLTKWPNDRGTPRVP
jgi:hypothetical protein